MDTGRSRLEDQEAVRRYRERGAVTVERSAVLSAAWLRDLALEAGADDAAAVNLTHAGLEGEREHVELAMSGAAAVVGIVLRMNRESVRSPLRSIANLEFHHSGDEVNAVAQRVVRRLERAGVRALNPPATFPHEMDRFPGRAWVLSLKHVAVAAGLGRMGINRNVIHPRFGNFVLLGAVLVDRPVDEAPPELDYNPCVECKLCVAACPVGAIAPDGGFDFQACYTHNYREFMSGFTDFVETVADSADGADFRARVSDSEAASMWQSLSFKPSYKAAYCMSVCPAGDDVIGPYLDDRRGFNEQVVRPLRDKAEPVYVLEGSHAEEYVTKRFPGKTPVRVRNGFPDAVNAGLAAMAPRKPSAAGGREGG